VEFLKRFGEFIPFLEPYPPWVKGVVAAWILFTAVMFVCLLFFRGRSQEPTPFHLSGRVVTAGAGPVSAAIVDLTGSGISATATTDSEGYFGIDAARPAGTLRGRIRIAATGYRSYDRILEVQPSSSDLGSFTLTPDAVPGMEDPEVQIQRRQQALLEVPQDITNRYASVLSNGNAGVIKLLSEQAVEANRAALKIRGEGQYYSFTRRTHEYGHGSDIKLENGNLSTGFAGLDYGYFLNVGNISFEDLARASLSPPPGLPSAKFVAWNHMWVYTPPTVTVDVRRAQREARSKVFGGVSIAERAAAVAGTSYLLRSINYNASDLLVAIRVERLTPDGSAVLAWKILNTFDTPVATGPEPEL
jgi:hypothetical protein